MTDHMEERDHQCTANAKATGARCTKSVIKGGTVCTKHGGSAPAVRAAADRRIAHAEAVKAVETYGLPRDVDPAQALLEEVHRTAGHVAWLGEKVRSIDPDALTWNLKSHTVGRMAQGQVDYIDEGAALSLWWELYARERKHLVEVCGAAIKAGVEERRVRLAESQGQLLAEVLRRVLDDPDLGLDAARRAIADRVVHRHLTAVAIEGA